MRVVETIPAPTMHHIIKVGLSTELLERLDAMRPFYPDAAYRKDIITVLIDEAHERLVEQTRQGGGEHVSRAGGTAVNL